MRDNHIVVGKILKNIGKNGDVKVLPLTDFPDRFKRLESVYLFLEHGNEYILNNDSELFEIANVDIQNESVIMKFHGISNQDDASKLRNALICIDEKDRIPLPDGRFYLYELIGFRVKAEGTYLGKVEKIENYGGDDLLKVKSFKEKFFFVPINEFFIIKINSSLKEIEINLIEGLIE
ncbi:MAG: 16S rRNA processing protein RimM [Ignavibacteria bacterium]|nr:16S rRNA processing protein RimM [Ignavibacteria bacterium]